MPVRQIDTPAGSVRLIPVSPSFVESASSRWPFGFVSGLAEGGEELTGIVLERSGKELYGVKLQQGEHGESDAVLFTQLNSALLAMALKGYLRASFTGLLVAGVYVRAKPNDQCETGFALFPAPDEKGREVKRPTDLPHIDMKIGFGGSTMSMAILDTIGANLKRMGLPQLIDIDVRPRSQMGNLRLEFLIAGSDIVVLRRARSDDEPVWGALAKSGHARVFHMPSVALTIPH